MIKFLLPIIIAFVFLVACSQKSYEKMPLKDDIYFLGFDGYSLVLKSDDGFKTATLKDSNGEIYHLNIENESCMGDEKSGVKICFKEKFSILFIKNEKRNLVVVPKFRRNLGEI